MNKHLSMFNNAKRHRYCFIKWFEVVNNFTWTGIVEAAKKFNSLYARAAVESNDTWLEPQMRWKFLSWHKWSELRLEMKQKQKQQPNHTRITILCNQTKGKWCQMLVEVRECENVEKWRTVWVESLSGLHWREESVNLVSKNLSADCHVSGFAQNDNVTD